MAETSISNIFSPLSERLRSPLLSAIIIAWFAWNWEIVYITLFLSFPEGTVLKLEMVKPLINWYKSALWPFCSGVAYMIIVPFLEDAAFRVMEWHKKIRKDRKVKMLGLRKNISPTELLQKYEELKEMKAEIAEISEEKINLANEKQELIDSVVNLKKQIFSKENEIGNFKLEIESQKEIVSKLHESANVLERSRQAFSIFGLGRWKFEWTSQLGSGADYFTVRNNGGKSFIYFEAGENYKIAEFESSLNQDRGSISFVKIQSVTQGKFNTVICSINIKEQFFFEGEEIHNNGNVYKVKYTKVMVSPNKP